MLRVDPRTGSRRPGRGRSLARSRARTFSPATRCGVAYLPAEQQGRRSSCRPRRRAHRGGHRAWRAGVHASLRHPVWAATSSRTRCWVSCVSCPTAWRGCGRILGPWVGILAATILVIATNAGPHRCVAARLLPRSAPPGAADPRARPPQASTPYVSIIVFGTIACLIILPGQHVLPGRPVRLRRHDLVHHRTRVGHRAAHQGARS